MQTTLAFKHLPTGDKGQNWGRRSNPVINMETIASTFLFVCFVYIKEHEKQTNTYQGICHVMSLLWSGYYQYTSGKIWWNFFCQLYVLCCKSTLHAIETEYSRRRGHRGSIGNRWWQSYFLSALVLHIPVSLLSLSSKTQVPLCCSQLISRRAMFPSVAFDESSVRSLTVTFDLLKTRDRSLWKLCFNQTRNSAAN